MNRRNGLFYYNIIKKLKHLEQKQIQLDKLFIEKYNILIQLYKEYPF
jgi:hypothetical protein